MARLGKFGRDRGGIAALEFALIAPLILLCLFGAFELTEALGMARRSENAAASIAEVMSRDSIVDDTEMNDVFGAVPALIAPSRGITLSVRITSIMIDDDGEAEVVWCEATVAGVNGPCDGADPFTALSTGDTVTLPAGVGQDNAGLIRVETVLPYVPPLGMVLNPIGFPIRHTEFRRPRVVDPVRRDGVSWTP